MAPLAGRAPRIRVGNTALARRPMVGLVLDVRVDRRLNLAGSDSVRFAGPPSKLGKATTLGTPFEVNTAEASPAFVGEVVGVEVTVLEGSHVITTVTAFDLAHRLSGRHRTVARLDSTADKVVESILSDHTISTEVASTPSQHKYLLQTGSDLDYVNTLLGRAGFDWWMDNGKFVAKKLEVGASTVSLALTELERIQVRISGKRPDSVVVHGWGIQNKAVTGKADLAVAMVGASGSLADAAAKKSVLGNQEHQIASIPVVDDAEAKAVAESALKRLASGAVHAELEGPGLWHIGPGQTVEVKNGEDVTGKYLITAVEHRYADGLTWSRLTAGDRRPEGVLGGDTGDSTAVDQFHGILVGIVDDLNDKENKGRVRVTLPGLADKQVSHWARVCSPGAGSEKGSTVRPDVGEEVLVAFEAGDLRKPVVLGSLYMASAGLPTLKLKNGKVQRTSLLHQYGHSIEFWDEGATQGIAIALKNGTVIKIDDQGTLLEDKSSKTTKIVQGQASIELKTDGTITIKGTKIILDGQQEVDIKGVTAVKVAASAGTASVEGVQLDLKGKATGTIDGGGMLNVKGGMVKIN